ncbi:hypothetical protein DFQ28_003865 [Apophysomyces sp. BC1034]|nr:hypothetical protein DFQ30_010600 [Apophysomyces sp. BC1015]KAG0180937.1 hypothetical protein DFQ29_009758 [Apophysomyces sp. BC1021]KAG0193692.1 hypothetical protein DFQ28_003865 [Apophysomyces sp. BC1034]
MPCINSGPNFGCLSNGIGASTSIQIHEGGLAHKNQVERFLRDVYKRGHQEQKQAESVRRELQRIEKAALQTFVSKDIGNESSLPSSSAAAAKIAQNRTAAFSTLPKAPKRSYNYALPPPPDIPEPDLSHLQGREEWAPRSAVALPGEWQIVKPTPPPESEAATTESKEGKTTHDQRPEFQDDEEEHDEEDLRNFKIREKEYPGHAFETKPEEDEAEGTDAAENGGLFKKRKAPQSNIKMKKRNIRKK